MFIFKNLKKAAFPKILGQQLGAVEVRFEDFLPQRVQRKLPARARKEDRRIIYPIRPLEFKWHEQLAFWVKQSSF